MIDILTELADAAKLRVSEQKKEVSMETIRELAYTMGRLRTFAFEGYLREEGISFICEVKKASPSKGIISEDFDYLQIAKDYEAAGADCISVLTEPTRFLGDIRYLKEIAETVQIPVLRKDFIIDEYMIYEAKVAGASAVLLITSILSENELKRFINICDELGLSALVEVHDEKEIGKAIECGARVIGVNNRNLRDFTVDPTNCLSLRKLVPQDILFVAESGIKTYADIRLLDENNVNAVLIGETLMRARDKRKKLLELGCGI